MAELLGLGPRGTWLGQGLPQPQMCLGFSRAFFLVVNKEDTLFASLGRRHGGGHSIEADRSSGGGRIFFRYDSTQLGGLAVRAQRARDSRDGNGEFLAGE